MKDLKEIKCEDYIIKKLRAPMKSNKGADLVPDSSLKKSTQRGNVGFVSDLLVEFYRISQFFPLLLKLTT